MDKVLGMIGLAKRAGMLECGEEPVGAACRARDTRLLLLAGDAADNTLRRAGHFAEAGQCVMLRLPVSKGELGRAVGRTSCAMLAVTDIGFAAAIAQKLRALDEARYADAAEKLELKAQRAAERRREQERHEKNLRMGKRREHPAPPPEPPRPQKPPRAGEGRVPPRRVGAQAGTKRPGGPKKGERPRAHDAAPRSPYANSRPVKKGKGSVKKQKP